jgi:hypothetical protein
MLVFIDESGDPGFKLAKGSTSAFVAVLVAFTDHDVARHAEVALEALAQRLRIAGEFKFHKSRSEVRDTFFATVVTFDFRVRAIVVEKERIYSKHLRADKNSFYSFFVKSMLKFDGGLLTGATVVIDGAGDRAYRQELRLI